jgi:hypothetical protein
VNGGARVTSGQWIASDIRWKKNITPYSGGLNKVLGLQAVNYEWKTDQYPEKVFDRGAQVGLIAQEVEKVLPQLVSTDFQGYKSVDYSKLTVFLVEAIKEQQKEIETLKKEVAELKGR